jgi:hypothetical protein
MKLDPRLIAIDQAPEPEEPADKFVDQVTVIVDNLMAGYWRDPQRTDAMLRRDGHATTADRLVEVFGPEWWKKL